MAQARGAVQEFATAVQYAGGEDQTGGTEFARHQ